MSFIIWHYTKGIKFYLGTWKNFVWFVLYFFSVKRLFSTLFAPWRRSLLIKDWEGFHPIQALLFHLTSTYFRFFGGLVRLAVIFFGLIIALLAIILGAMLFSVWLLLPLAIIFSFFIVFKSSLVFIVLLSIFILIVFLSITGYLDSRKEKALEMNFSQINNSPMIERILKRAEITKEEWNVIDFSKEDFQAPLEKLLIEKDLSLDDFNQIIKWEVARDHVKTNRKRFWTKESLHKILPIGRYWNYGYTRILDRFSIDLSKSDNTKYSEVELINYSGESEKIDLAFSKNDQASLILLGRPGIGKQSIIHYLAKKVRRNNAHPVFLYKRLVLIDLGEALNMAVDSDQNPASFLDEIFHEATAAGNVILVIKNISRYFNQEVALYKEIPALLTRYLDYPSFRIMATSSVKEYHQYIENNENFIKNCKTIEVSEPKEEDVIFMLMQKFEKLEEQGIFLSYQTINEAVKKSSFLGKITPFPGRAVTLMEDVLTYWKNNPGKVIDAQLVNEVVTLKTGVSQGVIQSDEKEKLLNLESILHQRIIGQELAIKKIAQAIKQSRAEMGEGNKPVGSFLFLGPTGVGKTETAKALAEGYYGDEKRMIRFDMNEYQESDSASRLVGSVENKTPGSLTSKVKDNPFSLVLLDELEKAHPDVLDIFLRILDEGYAQDAFDEKISFHGNIIIATSNAGSSLIKELVEKETDSEKIKETLIDHLIKENIYKVEFLNRFDDVIFYEPFTAEGLKQVTMLMLTNFAQKIEKEKNIQIRYSEDVIDKVIQDGYDSIFGARSIRRYINDKIKTLIVDKILKEGLTKGGQILIKTEDL